MALRSADVNMRFPAPGGADAVDVYSSEATIRQIVIDDIHRSPI